MLVSNGNHHSSGLTSAGSSTSSIETAMVTRTVAIEPTKNKKNKRNSAHLGSDKYLKSCTMDFQYIDVSGNGNACPVGNDTVSHQNDMSSGNLLAVTEEESVSVASSSDDSSAQLITLATALENVMIALEEPRGVFLIMTLYCIVYLLSNVNILFVLNDIVLWDLKQLI